MKRLLESKFLREVWEFVRKNLLVLGLFRSGVVLCLLLYSFRSVGAELRAVLGDEKVRVSRHSVAVTHCVKRRIIFDVLKMKQRIHR